MTSWNAFNKQVVHSLFDLDEMGSLTIPAGIFINCMDGPTEVDRPISYRIDEPIPPIYIWSGSNSLVVRERSHCRHTGRWLVVTTGDESILCLAYTGRGWLCRQISAPAIVRTYTRQFALLVTEKAKPHATHFNSDLDWKPAPDNEFVFRGPYAGYRIVELNCLGRLRHCSGDYWKIMSEEPIGFVTCGMSFVKRAGKDEPLFVRFRNGDICAFRVIDFKVYIADVANSEAISDLFRFVDPIS